MKLTKKEIARRLAKQRIAEIATSIAGIVMQHTSRDDLTGPYVRLLLRTLNQLKSGPRWKDLNPEGQRTIVKIIVCLEQVDIEILRREYFATPTT